MANTVTNIIKIVANNAAIDAVDERFINAGGYSETGKFVKAFYDNPELSENGEGVMFSWSLDHVGSKWIYVENEIDNGEWNIASASYYPHEFLQRLFELVTVIDPEGYIENRYNDETYEPTGVVVFKKDSNGVPRWFEIEEQLENPTDDMDWEDENYDEAQSQFMDSIYDFQEESVAEAIETIASGSGNEFKTIQ